MKQVCVLSLLLIWLSAMPSAAATYSWSDEKGVLHFTEDLGKIPENVRNRATVRDDTEASPEESHDLNEPAARGAETATKAVPPGSSDDSRTFAGRTRGEWQKELADRGSAMTAVRTRLDEISALLKEYTGSWEGQKELLQEYNSLSARLKTMKAEYFQQVENARKAGLTVTIEE